MIWKMGCAGSGAHNHCAVYQITCQITYLILVAVILTGCSGASGDGKPATLDDLNDPSVTIGGITGSVHEPFIAQVFPRAQEKQFNTLSEMITALENGEIDAFVHAKDNILSAMEENPGRLRMIDEPVGEAMAGMAISPRTKYPELKSQVKKGLKKGNYTLKKVSASGNSKYLPAARTVKATIKVK